MEVGKAPDKVEKFRRLGDGYCDEEGVEGELEEVSLFLGIY